MKTRHILPAALLIPLLLASCGRKDSPPPLRAQEDPAGIPPAAAAMPDAAGPAGLPPCPGFLSLESASGDSAAGSSVLISGQTAARLVESYATDLSAEGWILATTIQQGREHHLLFRRGERFLRLQIGPADSPPGASRLLLAWGQTAGASAVREAYEPDIEEESAAAAERSLEW